MPVGTRGHANVDVAFLEAREILRHHELVVDDGSWNDAAVEGAEMAEFVQSRKGGGSIIVNEAGHAVTFLAEEPVFLGTIDPSSFEYESDEASITDEPDELTDLL